MHIICKTAKFLWRRAFFFLQSMMIIYKYIVKFFFFLQPFARIGNTIWLQWCRNVPIRAVCNWFFPIDIFAPNQRWLWDGIFWDPYSQIPGILDFFLPKNPESLRINDEKFWFNQKEWFVKFRFLWIKRGIIRPYLFMTYIWLTT